MTHPVVAHPGMAAVASPIEVLRPRGRPGQNTAGATRLQAGGASAPQAIERLLAASARRRSRRTTSSSFSVAQNGAAYCSLPVGHRQNSQRRSRVRLRAAITSSNTRTRLRSSVRKLTSLAAIPRPFIHQPNDKHHKHQFAIYRGYLDC